MADKKAEHKPAGVLDALEEGLIENIAWVAVAIILFLLWQFNLLYSFIRELLPLVGVVVLGRVAWVIWVHYIQQDFISGIDFCLLEIVPPREVLRSPKAMELFIANSFFHFSTKGGKEEFWQGAVWFWFSLEIASIEGQVHFFVRTPTRIRGLIETQMYAQYPQSQVKVVEDYTLAVDEISPKSSWMGWGCEWGLLKHEAYPIKTYIDYGLDKDPDEELKVDPISPVIELFGSLGKGEQAWLQIVITPADKTKVWKTKGKWFETHGWVEECKGEILRMLAPYTSIKDEGARIEVRVPSYLDRASKAMSAKTSKLGFETGIRLMYVAKKEKFDMSTRRNIRLIFRQYQAPDINGFDRINSSQGDRYSGIFSASPETVMLLANRMLLEFQERAFFHVPLRHHLFNQHTVPWPLSGIVKAYVHHKTFVLNTEELATLWHFPGQILKVPTLERIESKEASPPTNLPI